MRDASSLLLKTILYGFDALSQLLSQGILFIGINNYVASAYGMTFLLYFYDVNVLSIFFWIYSLIREAGDVYASLRVEKGRGGERRGRRGREECFYPAV